MLDRSQAVLLVIDVQGKLAEAMFERERLYAELGRLIGGARVLGLPVCCTEQLPEKLGPTVPEIADALEGLERWPKSAFSCCGCEAFMQALAASGRRQVLIGGIETHVCVWQTARDLLARGYQVQVVADAVSSRTAANRQLGLDRLAAAGAVLTGVEMALMELLGDAADPDFKAILKLIK